MKLTVKTVEAAKPADKEYMLPDGDRLYLRVQPRGSKSWLFLYSDIAGRRVKLTLGAYPAMLLAVARAAAERQRLNLQAGKDPRQVMRETHQEARRHALATFEKVAREWHAHAKQIHDWSEDYSQKILRQLELHAFPRLGRHPIGSLNRLDVLQCLEAVSLAGTRETAIRLRESLQRIFARAVTVGLLEPGENYMAKGVADFKLRSPITKHYATILEPHKVGQLIRDIRGYKGHYIVCCALRIMPYVFQRPGQIRMMEWDQLDLDDGIWICPPRMMKAREAHKNSGQVAPHTVPLPTQVVAILRQLHTVTGPIGPVFKSVSRRRGKNGYSRYISDNTMNSALRALGYDTQTDITGHGFRAMARTLIRERLGWDREMIEKHLAHVSDEELGEAYDRTRFIEQRHEMAQAWADYLDSLAEQTRRPRHPGRKRLIATAAVVSIKSQPGPCAAASVTHPANPRTLGGSLDGAGLHQPEAAGVLLPLLQIPAPPPLGRAVQRHRRGESAGRNAPIQAGAAQGRHAQHVAHAIEHG